MSQTIGAAAAARLASPGSRVYVAGCTGEPTAILDAVDADPELWRAVTLTGVFIPSVNERDLATLGQATRVESFFVTGALRRGVAAGSVAVLPLHYTQIWRHLSTAGSVDVAYIQVAPPDLMNRFGLGLAADFSPAVVASGARLVGVVNPAMPRVPSAPAIPRARFAALVEAEAPLVTYACGPIGPEIAAIAHLVVAAIPAGATLQLGLGKLQGAVLAALAGQRDLGFHAGMISDGILPHLEAGTFERGITTGVAIGSRTLYDTVATCDRPKFRPVGETHAMSTLAAIPRLVAVNSVLEVDLFGQANADTLHGRPVSGHGGMLDFVRGAAASPGGRSILALPSMSSDGESRIRPTLSAGTPVSVPRADADMVVTEHGVAALRGASVAQRAARLIAIAAPQHRESLARAWHTGRPDGSA